MGSGPAMRQSLSCRLTIRVALSQWQRRLISVVPGNQRSSQLSHDAWSKSRRDCRNPRPPNLGMLKRYAHLRETHTTGVVARMHAKIFAAEGKLSSPPINLA